MHFDTSARYTCNFEIIIEHSQSFVNKNCDAFTRYTHKSYAKLLFKTLELSLITHFFVNRILNLFSKKIRFHVIIITFKASTIIKLAISEIEGLLSIFLGIYRASF